MPTSEEKVPSSKSSKKRPFVNSYRKDIKELVKTFENSFNFSIKDRLKFRTKSNEEIIKVNEAVKKIKKLIKKLNISIEKEKLTKSRNNIKDISDNSQKNEPLNIDITDDLLKFTDVELAKALAHLISDKPQEIEPNLESTGEGKAAKRVKKNAPISEKLTDVEAKANLGKMEKLTVTTGIRKRKHKPSTETKPIKKSKKRHKPNQS